jgi:hypothetical protein
LVLPLVSHVTVSPVETLTVAGSHVLADVALMVASAVVSAAAAALTPAITQPTAITATAARTPPRRIMLLSRTVLPPLLHD